MNLSQRLIGGPYQVDLKKTYKPIFICMVDLIIALTFFIDSIGYYWLKLDLNMKLTDINGFIPGRIYVYICLFFFKFVFDVGYLRLFMSKEFINRSSSTESIFWARIFYDVITIGTVILFYKFNDLSDI